MELPPFEELPASLEFAVSITEALSLCATAVELKEPLVKPVNVVAVLPV